MTDERREFLEALREQILAARELEQRLLAQHDSCSRRELEARLLVELRCEKDNRVLLQVWRSDGDGLAWFVPSYRLSPGRTAATSTPEGRAANADESGRWRAQAGALGDSAVLIQCNHRPQTPMSADDLWNWADQAVTSGRPTRRSL